MQLFVANYRNVEALSVHGGDEGTSELQLTDITFLK